MNRIEKTDEILFLDLARVSQIPRSLIFQKNSSCRKRGNRNQAMTTQAKNILYICTGNVFRSPVAAGMTKLLLGDKNIEVNSAGILQYAGDPLSQDRMELARRYGVDLSEHKPRQVSIRLVDAADLILVFDKNQVTELNDRFPQARSKTYTIKNYAGYSDDQDMEDLWNKPLEVFERFVEELSVYLEKCVDRIGQNKQDGSN